MRLLLTNCPECSRLMLRHPWRKLCSTCLEQQNEEADSATELDEPIDLDEAPELGEGLGKCQICGKELDAVDEYCVRCRLQLARMSKESIHELDDKLSRFPALRGKNRKFLEGSRSHIRHILEGRHGSKKRSYTPNTKYSS